jgi:hypothetical protein
MAAVITDGPGSDGEDPDHRRGNKGCRSKSSVAAALPFVEGLRARTWGTPHGASSLLNGPLHLKVDINFEARVSVE